MRQFLGIKLVRVRVRKYTSGTTAAELFCLDQTGCGSNAWYAELKWGVALYNVMHQVEEREGEEEKERNRRGGKGGGERTGGGREESRRSKKRMRKKQEE